MKLEFTKLTFPTMRIWTEWQLQPMTQRSQQSTDGEDLRELRVS